LQAGIKKETKMQRTGKLMSQLIPRLKQKAIAAGVYKPARWLMDHVANRSRLESRKTLAHLLSTFVKPGDLCFDVGANIGDYTQTLLSIGARVVCVDPQPLAIRELTARYARNSRVKIEPVGLGARPGEATFYLRDHHGASGFYPDLDSPYKATTTVPVDTLENLVARHGTPNYVKIDVEGHELEVIRGLKTRIPYLSVEYHLDEKDCGQKLGLIERLAESSELSFNILPQGNSHFLWPDFIEMTTFRQTFPRILTGNSNHTYGDIFIRCKPPYLQ
jgi:FkbM family methyltransferase